MEQWSRRDFLRGSLGLAGLSLLTGCWLPFQAQQPAKVPRLGWLTSGSTTWFAPFLAVFWDGMRELGYLEGQNITLEQRHSEDKGENLAILAADLMRLPPDIILATGTPATQAAKRATSTIPIIMLGVADPVTNDLVPSLSQPGGNVTGLSNFAPLLGVKRLELLKQAFPEVARVGVVWNPDNPAGALVWNNSQAAAQRVGLQTVSLEIRGPHDVEGAFAAATKEHTDALSVSADPLILAHIGLLLEFAQRSRLPAMYQVKENVDIGGLMSYGPSLRDTHRRAATYVDKILKGAKPADLPVEQPTTFELAVNLATARDLGLTIPQSVLQQATEFIQ